MKTRTCECGKLMSYGSMSSPACEVCEDCGTTLAIRGYPRSGAIPHDPVMRYDQKTGVGHRECRRCHKHLDGPDEAIDYPRLYHELLMAVETKWDGETRHQTALRYIREAEQGEGFLSECAGKTDKPNKETP